MKSPSNVSVMNSLRASSNVRTTSLTAAATPDILTQRVVSPGAPQYVACAPGNLPAGSSQITMLSLVQKPSVIPGLVSISLVVGCIGIMNIMLLSVSDRTHEIGLRKSLGAKRKDIMFQFLTEASTLSIIGSIMGIGIGLGLAALVDRFSPLPATISLPWILLAIVLGVGVGVTSGIYPAYRASKLDPIEALRAE